MKVRINPEQCKNVGLALKCIKVSSNPYCQKAKTPEDKEKEASFLFYVITICHDTKTLEGNIDGKYMKGWDYLVAVLRKKQESDPDFFTPERMKNLTVDEIKPLLSTINRIEERVNLLNDCGKKLSEKFDGKVIRLFEMSEGFLLKKDGKGLLKLLSEFEAYKDPLSKKSVVFLHCCSDVGLLRIKDPQNFKMPIDYHMMRVALRTGIIDVIDKELETRLKNKEPVNEKDVLMIRLKAQEAYQIISEYSMFDIPQLDLIFWSLGRSCCDWRHEPICGDKKCDVQNRCTLIRNVEFDCKNSCPLDETCFGSKNHEFRKFYEANIVTTYY